LARERRQVQRKDGFEEFLTPEALRGQGLEERYRTVTFDRGTAIRNPHAEFLAIGHPFVDAMLRHIGDYSSGGHTAVRVVRVVGQKREAPETGFQFNFTVRRRVAREDGDEYLFDWHTIVVLADGAVDEGLGAVAAGHYSVAVDESKAGCGEIFRKLTSSDLERAYLSAKAYLEQRTQLWDWD